MIPPTPAASRMSDTSNDPAPSLIPLELLFGNPNRAMPRLSPDGARLAFLAPDDGVLNVWLGPVGEDRFEPVTNDRDRGIRTYFWGHDGESILYLQDTGGDEDWHLFRVDLTTKETSDLTPFEHVQAQVLEYTKHHPTQLVLGLNRRDQRFHDAYLLDLNTGTMDLIAENSGDVIGWVADADLAVRGAMAARPDGGFDLRVRPTAESDWEVVLTWSADENLNSQPVAFSADGGTLYLLDSRFSNAARLVAHDLATGIDTVMAEDPTYDVSAIEIDPDSREVQLVAFARARVEWQAIDSTLTRELNVLGRADDGDFAIVNRTDADDRWLVAFTRDEGPTAYYELDRDRHEVRFLFHDRPALAGYALTKMEPVTFTASDGLTIHGYLTRPTGGSSSPGPLVLNVHGGPWARDMWGYDAEAQWLANRGFGCLQVNYRGSTGYGKDFINAGDREWGGKMHRDLVDAVRWAVDEGVADPARVAIYGGSYGGYAALVGATFTPDLFACAVDIVGPSNLITFIQSIPEYWSTYLEVLYQRVGHPEKDEAFLVERSPLSRVDDIKIPMLIAQGANDPRVKQAESEQIVAAMSRKGIDHEYLLFEDEGHGFAKPENRLQFYRVAETFLAQHLNGSNQ
jgi:dipeptidyl aminopeptidase/acylaminoacyl peptidase